VHISRNAADVPFFELLPDCEPFVDCDGIPGGVAIKDCNGDCGGSAMFGNTYEDEIIDEQDVEEYINMLMVDNPAVMPCYDLNDDEELSVYDAALEMWCMQSAGETGSLSNCYFPRDVVNPNDSTYLEIVDVNFSSNYLDVQLHSERANIVGYQFRISGIVIDDVAPLTNPSDMPIHLGYNTMRNEVFGLFSGDSIITHSTADVNLVRVYFSSVTGGEICISEIIDIPNNIGEQTMTFTRGDCFMPSSVSIESVGERSHLTILPNPATDKALVNVPSNFEGNSNWQLFDATGRFVQDFSAQKSSMQNQFSIALSGLSTGIYILRVSDSKGHSAIGRLVKQ
jgi:hypothetical protein